MASPSVMTAVGAPSRLEQPPPGFDDIYDEYFPFVWRTLHRLGVPKTELDDAAQEVFLVVHRKLETYDRTSSVRTWLFGITQLMAWSLGRQRQRRPGHALLDPGTPSLGPDPERNCAAGECAAFVRRFLDTLDPRRRAVFVAVELEQMPVPEVALALGLKLNTTYSRLRAARTAFQKAVTTEMRGDP